MGAGLQYHANLSRKARAAHCRCTARCTPCTYVLSAHQIQLLQRTSSSVQWCAMVVLFGGEFCGVALQCAGKAIFIPTVLPRHALAEDQEG